MKRRFIVLIDCSEYSADLLRYAYDCARQTNAELLLLHQPAIIAPALADVNTKADLIRQANEAALDQLNDLKTAVLPPSARVSFLVREQHLILTLQELLAEPGDNLVFVGLKGTGLLKKMLLGSVAIEVIEHSNHTVFAVPKAVTSFSPQNLFVAVSNKYPVNILALNNFLSLAADRVENISFFYMARPFEKTAVAETQLRDLSRLFGEKFKTSWTIYEGSGSFNAVKSLINKRTEEILIVQKGSRLLTDKLFRRFLIHDLVYEGQTPLVVLP